MLIVRNVKSPAGSRPVPIRIAIPELHRHPDMAAPAAGQQRRQAQRG